MSSIIRCSKTQNSLMISSTARNPTNARSSVMNRILKKIPTRKTDLVLPWTKVVTKRLLKKRRRTTKENSRSCEIDERKPPKKPKSKVLPRKVHLGAGTRK